MYNSYIIKQIIFSGDKERPNFIQINIICLIFNNLYCLVSYKQLYVHDEWKLRLIWGIVSKSITFANNTQTNH